MSSSLIFGLQDPQDYRSEVLMGGWDYPDYQAGPRSREEEDGDYTHQADYDYADYNSPRQVKAYPYTVVRNFPYKARYQKSY